MDDLYSNIDDSYMVKHIFILSIHQLLVSWLVNSYFTLMNYHISGYAVRLIQYGKKTIWSLIAMDSFFKKWFTSVESSIETAAGMLTLLKSPYMLMINK